MRAGWMVVVGLVACGGPAKQTARPQPIANEVKPAEPPPPVAVEAGSGEVHGGLLANEPSEPPAEPAPTTVSEDGKAEPLGTYKMEEGGAFASLTGTGDISSGFDDAEIHEPLGAGPGGGGTGWGTIGTGRYGTIGQRSGTGTGYSVGTGRRGGMKRPGTPTVKIGQPAAKGELDKAIIRRYVRRKLNHIQYCYEKQLVAKDPKLSGTVTVEFTIGGDGKVSASTAAGVDPDVAACIAEVIRQIEFPKPRGGGEVSVNYPFALRPK